MNVKGLFGNMITPGIRSTERTERTLRSDSTHDRDPNGQQAPPDQQEQKEPMTEEEFERAVQYLKTLPAVIEHKWKVEVAKADDKKFVLVRDNLGSIIRKIPENELRNLPTDQVEKKGHLLNKAA